MAGRALLDAEVRCGAAASADVSCQGPPLIALAPFAAAASQSDGKVNVANTLPESAAAQFAGWAPVLISRVGPVLIADSIASSRALRTATES